MTGFLAMAALLVAGALLLLVPPLVRRHGRARVEADQPATALAVLREQLADLEAERAAGRIDAETYARSRDELESRALEEGAREAAAAGAPWRPARAWGAALLVGVPALAAGLYLAIGNPDGLDPAKVAGVGQQQFSQEQIEGLVASLASRLEKEPDNLEGWMMLARSYLMLGRPAEAEKAYRHLAAKLPDNPQVLADWADALGGAQGRTLVGEPERIIAQALRLDPKHLKALALAGSVAFEKGDYAAAAGHWETLLAQLPAGDELAESVRASIAEARTKGGLPPLAATPEAAPAARPAGLTVAGEVRLAPALAAQVRPDDVVFVFVRGGEGGPPIAALRFTVAQLPARFDFTGAPMMLQDQPIPARLVVAARVSRSGQPRAAAGDLEGFSPPVGRDASGVTVTVDQVRP